MHFFFGRRLCVEHRVRHGRGHFPVRLLGCGRLQGMEWPDLPAEGQSAAQVPNTHSPPVHHHAEVSQPPRAHRSYSPPPLAGWSVSSGSTLSVGPSCLSCAGPRALRPPWSDCCSTTAAGLSSGMCSWPTGCRRVRLLGRSFAFLHCNQAPTAYAYRVSHKCEK